ncbi:MAG: hypothetical protein J5J06_00795 [Phycisphaerae bacterium]|nr:hypothetical protein [Phycisphaerae bacterium]
MTRVLASLHGTVTAWLQFRRLLIHGDTRKMPLPLARLVRCFRWSPLLLPLFFVGVAIVFRSLGKQGPFSGAGVGSFVLYLAMFLFIMFAIITVGAYRFRNLCTRMLVADYRVCTYCGYELSGLPGEYTCPECGLAYNLDAVQAKWKDVLLC